MALGIVVAGLTLAGACGVSDDEWEASNTTTTEPLRADDSLLLNEIQVIGTHNSFHVAPEPTELDLITAMDPEQAIERDYTHRSISEQLIDQQVRQLELDVFVDTDGGLYADPAFREEAGLGPYEAPGIDEPGIKVLHEQDVDYHTVCPTLWSCLSEIKTWSDANPDHVPVAVHIQFKDGPLIFDVPGQAVPEKWTSEQMDALDAEILDVFPREQILTPADVLGDHETLNEAVLDGGWPTLGDSRGKVMFLMINAEPDRSIYLEGHEDLSDRLLFPNAEPGDTDAAYVGVDDPLTDGDRITELVEEGYLVRTRADVPGVQAPAGDPARRDAALASGAQWVSTDYPGPDGAREQFGTPYVAAIPDGLAARCNPVVAPPDCEDLLVEPSAVNTGG